MQTSYIIKNEETGKYLGALNIGTTATIIEPIYWRSLPTKAIHFENKEEAEATIAFIGAVLDWELEEQLQIIEVKY